MSLDIAIKVDPGDSAAKIKSVESGLAAAEARGKAAGQSMAAVGGAFKSLGQAVEQERAALQRATEIHDRLVRQSQPLAQGFEKIANQIAREKRILDEIRAPQQEYFDKLTALDKLLERNAISTREYADQVSNMNHQMEQTKTPSAPAGPSVGGALMNFAGAGALPGAVLAVGQQVEQLIQEAEELQDHYTEMANRSMKFADATHSTNMIIDEQVSLAHQLHATTTKTIELYDGVRDASDGMNVSHQEQIRIAQTLGEASLIGGKAVDAAAQSFINLRVAFETGQDPARSMRSIFKEFPDLADQMTESLGMTKEQILDMASKGKLGYQDILLSATNATQGLDDAWQQRKKTNAEEREEIAETASVAMGRGVPSMMAQSDAGRKWAETQQLMKDGWTKDVRPVFQQIAADLEEQKVKWQRAKDAAAEAFGEKLRQLVTGIDQALQGVSSSIGKISDSLMSEGFYAIVKLQDPWFVAPDTKKKIDANAHAVREMSINLLAMYRQQREFDDAKKKREGAEGREFDRVADRGFKQQAEDEKDYLSAHEAFLQSIGKNEERVRKEQEKQRDDETKASDKLADKSAADAQKMEDAWASAGGKIAGELVSAFMKGDQSASQMIDSIGQKLAVLMLQMAAMQMGGPGGAFLSAFAGGLGGGANGFDYVANSNRLQLPGFATGGDFTVGGSGGTDSKIAMFRVTPGESVHVRTPAQQQMSGTSQASPVHVTNVVHVQSDPREITSAMGSSSGQREYVKLARKFNQRG